jgi:hypothetical protein
MGAKLRKNPQTYHGFADFLILITDCNDATANVVIL